MRQKIGIKKIESLVQVSCGHCDVDNDAHARDIRTNSFQPNYPYTISCEGCGEKIEFELIEI